MEKNWIKKYVVDILPCIAASVYTLAVVYNIAYFSVFGIDVLHYINLTDMLMNILEPLIFVLLITLLMSLLTVLSLKTNHVTIKEAKAVLKKKWIADECVCKYLKKVWNTFIKIWNSAPFKWLKKIRERNSRHAKDVPYKFVGSVILLVIISFICYLSFLQSVGKESGIHLAAMALALPPVLLLESFHLVYSLNEKFDFHEELKKVSSFELICSLLVYYFYGLVIFYKNGLDSGEYILHHNQTRFEISAANDNTFTNEDFGYIEQLNENIFLFEKKTGDVVILSKSNLTYTKIDFTKTQRGLIPALVGDFDKIFPLTKNTNKDK